PKRDPGSTKVYDFRELVKSKTDGGIARWSDPTIDSIDESIDKSLIAFNIGGIAFKAYLGTLTDSFAPGWNGEADQGRADSRYLYTSFERTIQTDFMVPVYKEAYRSEIWNKLQNLARKTYPVYGSNGFYGQSIDVTIGDLYKSKKMIITDLSYDWDNETPWEITKGIQAPMYTNVSISFTVLSPKPTSNDKVYMNI
ncbi:MAG: hypothetical protein H8E55_48405, partial [Pelagibacterales bacterium]|nr:hypothetical protein [Pelagibacterales bacterium]